jgi:glycosyltransferase involved in cell wall biosynthesis
LRVAFITVGDTSRLTGGYLYHARVFPGLREEGIEVEEIVASGASPDEQEAAAAGLATRIDLRYFDVLVVDALARIACAPWLDGWRAARPVVAMMHELPSVAADRDTVLERELEEPLLRADRIIAVSEHGSSILRERGVRPERISVVSPGFDYLSPPDASVPHSSRDGCPIHALCVAQWIPRKNILGLIQAWASRHRPEAILELIGEKEVQPTYSASIHATMEECRSSIRVRGPVDDAELEGAYEAADLFVLPSRYEGYGIVYAEALGHGLPVVACDVGPIPELVGKEAALLVPPDDIEALSAALDLLLKDPALRRRMSVAARHRAEHLPRWKDTVAGFRRVLQEVLAETRRNDRLSS